MLVNNSFLSFITIDDFKTLFMRDFSLFFLPTYSSSKVYKENDVVYYNNNFYTSLKDNNTDVLPTTPNFWKVTYYNIYDYILDEDINNAFNISSIMFNYSLLPNNDVIKLCFLYLAAHNLVLTLRNADQNLNSKMEQLLIQKSVDGISGTYVIPSQLSRNMLYNEYTKTEYGAKYLMLMAPYLTGNITAISGGSIP